MLGVLVSGRGSNLKAVLDAGIPVACVISNVPDVGALQIATAHKVPVHVVRHQDYGSREAFDETMVKLLRASGAEYVLLAGFMRLLTSAFLEPFALKTINVHPSLLPAFPGAHAVRDALAYGARVTGATVHYVDEGTDTGPIIMQEAIAVAADDTVETLHARIQVVEHRLVPQAIALHASGRLRVNDRKVSLS